jgi:hypothetical protein
MVKTNIDILQQNVAATKEALKGLDQQINALAAVRKQDPALEIDKLIQAKLLSVHSDIHTFKGAGLRLGLRRDNPTMRELEILSATWTRIQTNLEGIKIGRPIE